MAQINVFISYSWDSEVHKSWVRKLADELEVFDEIHVTWDGYDLDSLIDKNHFMESGITKADFVIIVASAKYKEKADQRIGGVGIETYLASANHWNDLLTKRSSRIIVLSCEPNSTPSYMSGHFHIDFSESNRYQAAISELISHIKGTAKIERPHKQRSIYSDNSSYTFTRTEDIIRINYKNRNPIVKGSDGTDYSGANRIKFELWETHSPAKNYFLSLSDNINIAQTIERASTALTNTKINPTHITVLRPKSGRPEQMLIERTFKASGIRSDIHESTYKEYIWDYCIDDDLKTTAPPTPIKNYTDQAILLHLDDGATQPHNSAVELLSTLLQKDSSAVAHLIIASGGMGKTSLCLSIAQNLHNRKDLRSSVVLIQAESIKKYVIEQGSIPTQVDTIYHLYELYSKYCKYDHIFDKTTFDLAILCGNLVVIIDGLDELVSTFQDRFNLDLFFRSIRQLHNELGSSNILLTTRNNLLINGANLSELNIAKYELLGFDNQACEKYLNKRFRGYENPSLLVQKVLTQVNKVKLQDQDERIVPFFVDILATVLEDELKERKKQDLTIEYQQTPYPSNNDLTDHIIYSVLRREETRHELNISATEVAQFISNLVIDYGKRWPSIEVLNRLKLLYDARAEGLFSKLSLNPLILISTDYFELKYEFLSSYFEVLFIIDGICSQSQQRELLHSLARLNTGTPEFKEVKKFFTGKYVELSSHLKKLIMAIREIAVSDSSATIPMEKEAAKRAIASLINIYVSVRNPSSDEFTSFIQEIYGIQKQASGINVINGLFIHGTLPPLDFSNLVISRSRFKAYKRLLDSKFCNTKFQYTVFEDCGNSNITTSSLDKSMIDVTCEIGDLNESFQLIDEDSIRESKMVELDATKFLNSFFRGDRFRENNKVHIRFSNKVRGLAQDRFNRLLTNNYVSIKVEKEVDTFYEISQTFQESVRRFLVNNYADGQMRDFFSFIKE